MSIVLDGTLGITSPAETVQGALTTTGNTILGDAATDTLNVGAGGLVKDASGNVGIGTASPAKTLHVSGSAYSNLVRMQNTGGTQSGVEFVNTGSGANPPTIGSKSDALFFETANAEQMRIDSAGLLKFNSGYGSVATAYGCRAWVNFNGTGTVAIRASGNVSSITDNGTGDYTVNFTTAMPDGNYSATQSVGNNNYGVMGIPAATNSTSALLLQSTTQYRIYSTSVNGGTGNTDVAVAFVAIFR